MRSRSETIGRMGDWLNPIVVKELRQAVQGRFVAAALLLLLTIQLAAVGIYIVSNGDFAGQFDAGRTAFMFLLAILMGVCLIFLPAYTAIRLAIERDTNVDLLFVTTIKPSAIVWGKMFAALTVTVLIFSACMPFMVFTYWLRGIDLPSIFVLMAASFLVVTVAIQLATFVACIPASRVFKVLLSLFVLLTFPQAYVATLSWSYYSLTSGIGSRLGSWSFWEPALTAIIIAAAVIGLLFSLSVALIKPVSANRALPVRLFLTSTWLVSGVAAAIIAYYENDNAPLSVWSVLNVIIFAAGFFVAVSERERLGPRVAREIPHSGLRLPVFFLFSGGASGVAWCSLMSLLTYAGIALLANNSAAFHSVRSTKDSQIWVAGLPLYALAYSMTALLVRRRLLARWLGAKHTWLVAALLLIAGCIIPFLIGYLLVFGNYPNTDEIGIWLVTNPFMLGVKSHQTTFLVFAAGWSLLAVLLNLDWFIDQVKAFKPWGAVEKSITLDLQR